MKIKDIGSIFPLYSDHYIERESSNDFFLNNKKLYSLCSEALCDIAVHHTSKGCNRVLIPSYTCNVVAESFLQYGWECSYYAVNRDMRIDEESLVNKFDEFKPTVVVAHPYYGMDFNDEESQILKKIKAKGCLLVIDLTQNALSTERLSFADYYVASLRKWFPMPDGGFLESYNSGVVMNPLEFDENNNFVIPQKDAMYLRGLYFKNTDEILKKISIRLNKQAEGIEQIDRHRISNFSYNILSSEDLRYNAERRKENYKILFEGIKDTDKIKRVNNDLANLTTAPLYFPVYVSDRQSLQAHLAQQRIYCPILWGVETPEVLINDTVRYIYDHILVIPVDQRNGDEDMIKIVEAIKEWNV